VSEYSTVVLDYPCEEQAVASIGTLLYENDAHAGAEVGESQEQIPYQSGWARGD
jgi:hypothetical protein